MAISCRHGQLARSCNICELEAENESLRAQVTMLRAENKRLNTVNAKLQRGYDQLEATVEHRIGELEGQLALAAKMSVAERKQHNELRRMEAEALAGAGKEVERILRAECQRLRDERDTARHDALAQMGLYQEMVNDIRRLISNPRLVWAMSDGDELRRELANIATSLLARPEAALKSLANLQAENDNLRARLMEYQQAAKMDETPVLRDELALAQARVAELEAQLRPIPNAPVAPEPSED